ncbi:hypothetical protein AK88_01572 [Plasmodium fragile]|uniref:TMEM205-like domain-containing protein n=1 Tax=Plasmodium fragile TaxID=5857 RepID=A0A0D9QST1_PLAFR|nr:uncharacterized protein AK88_01572 [Plasmodium fragile]KJP88691.1 hypothetical protein AK88_01572 [Plasmodium fragile]
MDEEEREDASAVEATLKKAKKKKKVKNKKSEKKPSDIVSCIAFLPRNKKKLAKTTNLATATTVKNANEKKKKKKKKGEESDSYDALQNVFNDEKENEKVISEDNIIEEDKKYIFEDELSVEKGDALILNGKIYTDVGTLEVHIVNYDEDIFNIYDDVIIDDYPLCLEVIGDSYYRNRNIVAVGTMKKEIGLWDINNIETLEALSYLGGTEKRSAKGGSRKKKKRRKEGGEADVGEEIAPAEEATQGECETRMAGEKRKQGKNKLQGHTECVTCLNASKLIPTLMCSGSKDCSIKLWDLSNLTYLHTFNFHKEEINNVSFHEKESSILLSTSSDKTLKIYDIRKHTVGLDIQLDSTPESTTWNKFNEKEIFLSDVDGYVNKIDIRYVADPSSSFSHNNTVRFKAFSNSCISLVSTHYPNLTLAGSEDGLVKAYDFGAFGEEGPPCVYTKNLKKNLYCMKDNEDWPNVIFFGCDKLYDWDLMSCTELRLSSLVLSIFPKLIIKNPQVLRPLLNVSWGYLFGSTFWLSLFSEIGLVRSLKNMKRIPVPETADEAKKQLEEIKKSEADFTRRREDFQYFFGFSTLFSGILLLSTVRLANHNMQLRISSTIVALSCLLNNLYLQNKVHSLKIQKESLYHDFIKNPKSESILAEIRKNKKDFHIYHGLSLLSLYVSFVGLTPYIFT